MQCPVGHPPRPAHSELCRERVQVTALRVDARAMVVYDNELRVAASRAGIKVLSPGLRQASQCLSRQFLSSWTRITVATADAREACPSHPAHAGVCFQ